MFTFGAKLHNYDKYPLYLLSQFLLITCLTQQLHDKYSYHSIQFLLLVFLTQNYITAPLITIRDCVGIIYIFRQ